MADFYFKTSKFQNILLQIPKSLRIPVTLLLFFLIGITWFIAVYRPLKSSYQTALTQYTALNSLQDMHFKIEKKNKKIEQRTNKKKSLTKNLQSSLNTQDFINQAITNIFSCAHEAHLSVLRHTPTKSQEHDVYLSSVFCDELQGSFESITLFLQLLTQNKITLQPLSIKITRSTMDNLKLIFEYSINIVRNVDENS
jgi:hypothetical protein